MNALLSDTGNDYLVITVCGETGLANADGQLLRLVVLAGAHGAAAHIQAPPRLRRARQTARPVPEVSTGRKPD